MSAALFGLGFLVGLTVGVGSTLVCLLAVNFGSVRSKESSDA